MSQVFSFRLDVNNPREAQVMQIIESWASRGYSLRLVLVEALLTYKQKEKDLDDYSSALEEIIALLQELRVDAHLGNGQKNQGKNLSELFLNSVVKTRRPGIKID